MQNRIKQKSKKSEQKNYKQVGKLAEKYYKQVGKLAETLQDTAEIIGKSYELGLYL